MSAVTQDAVGKVLDKWEFLNVQMDTAAKHWWSTHTPWDANPVDMPIWTEPWVVQCGGKKITGRLSAAVRTYAAIQCSDRYWSGKMQADRFNNVDCQAIADAAKLAGKNRQRWVMKHSVGICGVNKWKQRWSAFHTDQCARCNGAQETSAHVWCCQEPESLLVWDQSLLKLEESLEILDTDPTVAALLIEGLRAWHNNTQPSNTHSLLWTAQNAIGWQAALEGRLSTELAKQQQIYYDTIDSLRSSQRWIAAVIIAIQEVAWAQWERRNTVDLSTNAHWLLQKARIEAQEELRQGQGRLSDKGRQVWRLMRERTQAQVERLSANALRVWTSTVQRARNGTDTFIDRMRQGMATFLQR
jgi:hypothetical protein